MKFLATVTLIVCAAIVLPAQQRVIDSLLKLLPQKCEDTTRFNRLMLLAKSEMYIDPVQSMTYAREANRLSYSLKDQHRIGMSLISVGNAFLLGMQETDSCDRYYNAALAIARKTNDRLVEGSALNNLGNSSKLRNNLGTAQDYFEDALAIRRQIRDSSGIAATLSNLGSIWQQRGDYRKAIDYYLQALPIKEREGNKNAIASTLVNMANAYVDLNKPEKALEVLEKVEQLNRELGNNKGLALAFNTKGIAYFELQQYDKALECYHESERIRMEMHDTTLLAETYNNIGNVYYTLKDPAKALEFYRKSIACSKGSGDGQGLQYLCNFAVGLSLAGKTDSAFLMLARADSMSVAFGTPDARLAVLGAYIEVNESAGHYKEALEYMRIRTDLSDSLFKNDNIRQLDELEVKYQSAKKQKEIEMLQKQQEITEKDREREKLVIYGMAGGSVLLLLVVAVVIRSNRQRKRANAQLSEQNRIIAEKNKDITDSITYARRIQQSVLPDEKMMWALFSESFIFNRPRDIVSGDFYWMMRKGERTYLAVADCTGHGVPGALVSVVGINMLNRIMEQPGAPDPNVILAKLHTMVINALNKDSASRDTRDGMDIAMICIDRKEKKIIFSGASRPLYYSDTTGFHSIRGDRNSVAGEKQDDVPYLQHEFSVNGPVEIYLTSDGYADQFGETTGKKFLTRKLEELLASLHGKPMKEQAAAVEKAFLDWKGNVEQVDDVCLIGIRV